MDINCTCNRVYMAPGAAQETPLTATEKKLRKILSQTDRHTFIGECIHIALAKKSNHAFREIIPQLKDQVRDASAPLQKVIGEEGIRLLTQL